MSTRGSRATIPSNPRRNDRESRRRKKMPDLNALPPVENRDQVASSSSRVVHHGEHQPAPPALIDVDAIVDDDVVISSPRAFAEAKSKASRKRSRTLENDGEQAWITCNNRNRQSRLPASQTIINGDLYINLEASQNSKRRSMSSHLKPQPPPPLKKPAFSCPICMGQLVEEMSTKCGHIFCKNCIKMALSTQTKCPTCRKRTTMKDIIRVYLPAAE